MTKRIGGIMESGVPDDEKDWLYRRIEELEAKLAGSTAEGRLAGLEEAKVAVVAELERRHDAVEADAKKAGDAGDYQCANRLSNEATGFARSLYAAKLALDRSLAIRPTAQPEPRAAGTDACVKCGFVFGAIERNPERRPVQCWESCDKRAGWGFAENPPSAAGTGEPEEPPPPDPPCKPYPPNPDSRYMCEHCTDRCRHQEDREPHVHLASARTMWWMERLFGKPETERDTTTESAHDDGKAGGGG